MIQNIIPIFLSSDNNYAPFVATTIVSVCKNTKAFCQFYILDGGILSNNQQKIFKLQETFNNLSIEFIKIDIKNEFKNINYQNNCHYVTISTYNRILIPNLKHDIKKCIYLDVDIILMDDIQKLFNCHLNDYALGAIEDFESNLRNGSFIRSDHKYFNAGVLLIDCDKWKENHITEKLFDIEVKYRNQLRFADQDLLNKYFENKYQELAPKFNVIFPKNDTEIVVRHYAGDLKPYFFSSNVETTFLPNIKEFWDCVEYSGFDQEIKSLTKPKEEQAALIRKMQFLNMLKVVKK